MSNGHKGRVAKAWQLEAVLWVYEQHLNSLTLAQITARLALPKEQGGLGIVRSRTAVWRWIETERAERRALLGSLVDDERAAEAEAMTMREREWLKLAAPTYVDEDGRTRQTSVTQRMAALTGLEKVKAERRKLLGLDMPIRVEANVTHHDANDAELNALLDRAAKADAKAVARG